MANVQSVASPHVAPEPAGLSAADLIAQNTALLARIAKLEASTPRTGIVFKVSPKKAVSIYGLQRYPVTLYLEQWTRLISDVPQLVAFIDAHRSELATKADE